MAKISPAKVPRLIGKKGSMIKSIEAGTHCRMLIGQNGIVIIVGAVEDSMKAAKAVSLVEEEAHSADLTARPRGWSDVDRADLRAPGASRCGFAWCWRRCWGPACRTLQWHAAIQPARQCRLVLSPAAGQRGPDWRCLGLGVLILIHSMTLAANHRPARGLR